MGSEATDVDVLVVGLGPGGGTAARQAAAAGLRVLAIDKKRRIGEPVQCAEFVPLPLRPYTLAAGVLTQPVAGMKSFLPSGAVERSAFPGLMIDRAAFDRALAAAAESEGAQLQTQAHLVDVDAPRSRARIARAGAVREVRYRVLIAADGPHSPTAAALGLPPLEMVYTRQYTTPLLQTYRDTDVWLSEDFPGGYGWLFPRGAVANVGLGADRRLAPDMKRPLDRLHARLVAQGIVGERIVARTGGAIPVGGLRAALVCGNVLFVGDAAGLTHPITGAGIGAAIASGERAGTAAAAFIGGNVQAFAEFDADVRDQFEFTLARAVARRGELAACWRDARARNDGTLRRSWIAFPEYFAH